MDGLFNSLGVLITPYVNIVPRSRGKKVISELLDGSLLVQVIGTPAKLLRAEIKVLTDAQKEEVETALGIASTLTIIERGTFWDCIILDEELDWTKRAGVWRAEAEMAVQATGPAS